MNRKIQQRIKLLREKIEQFHDEYKEMSDQWYFENIIDDFLNSTEHSDLEKAFFLMLNQYTVEPKPYFVIPHEEVLVSNVYDYSNPFFRYEIDFAIYSGSISKPIKIAVECDGIRSHRQRHNERDRRKDVNLQAAGWTVIRIGSKEIHDELEAFEKNENHICEIASNIENVVKRTMDLITQENYVDMELRSRLTGYTWDFIKCPKCEETQMDMKESHSFKCRHCGHKFSNPEKQYF